MRRTAAPSPSVSPAVHLSSTPSMSTRVRSLALVLATMLAHPSTADAQVRASELGSVAQTVDGTRLTITYSRPRARGRDPLFGTRAVHWDETWTPGANWATTLDVSRDLTMNGQRVPKGTYSVWMVVRKTGDWTVLLDPRARRFHEERPDSIAGQIRFAARPEAAPSADVLTWSFPAIRMNGGTLAMHWGSVRVPIDFAVEPTLRVELPAADAAAYVGRYVFRTPVDWFGQSKTVAMKVLYENGTLKGELEPWDGYFKRFALIRIAPDWFASGIYDTDGTVYEVLRPDLTFEFSRANGRVTQVELRDEDEKSQGVGRRTP